ncbi:LOW QUALITY PROTEIN: hypothetical protein PHMEG_00017579 [Phytophthora megakarya]|uniref:Uncharacterized protein n=1 Tax=Phytophthora megakarya TaxID=4795 RepID=A0A225VW91_9STRA|nr:LOW QUALITY PROTEIN: hypothetical protein PHMEG_00017579 [Phytophthora megakarya]
MSSKPSMYQWTTVCNDLVREDAQLLMEDVKVSIIVKIQLVPCTICILTRPHKMRYQLLLCSSGTCKPATPYDACPWTGKVLTCQELNCVSIMESGSHETRIRDPKIPQLTPRMKDNDRELASQGQLVSIEGWIGNSVSQRLPTLQQVQ